MSRARSALIVAATLFITWPSFAAPSLVEGYEAPVACPNAAWFERELRSRAPTPSHERRAVRVVVTKRDGRFVGRVQLGDSTPDTAGREVSHSNCESVIKALALIAALALDPSEEADLHDASHATEAVPPERAAKAAAPQQTVADSHAFDKGQPRANDSAWPMRGSPVGATPPPWRVGHGFRIGATAQPLIAPELRVGPRLGYRLLVERAKRGWDFGLALTRVQSGALRVTDVGNAELTLIAARWQVCSTFSPAKQAWLGPCAALDMGSLAGRGAVNGKGRMTRRTAWLSPGLLGRVEWRATRVLSLEGYGGALFPLMRSSFHFSRADGSELPIYTTPKNLGISADLAMSLHF